MQRLSLIVFSVRGQTRKTFDAPISKHQAVQFLLADMAVRYESARYAPASYYSV